MKPIDLALLIAAAGFVQGIFVALVLFSRTSAKSRSDRILGGLLILCSMNIAHAVSGQLGWFSAHFHGNFIIEPLQFLLAPGMALYFRTVLSPNLPLRGWDWSHLLPSAAVVSFVLLPWPEAWESPHVLPWISVGLWFLLIVQALAYLFPLLARVRAYSRNLRDQVSNLRGLDRSWMSWFFHSFVLLYALFFVILILMVHSSEFPPVRMYLYLILSALVWVLGYLGLVQKEPSGVNGVPSKPEAVYERSSLPSNEASKIKDRLENLMVNEKLFLDPDLSLSSLADRLGIGRTPLSFVINRVLGKNFYDFINEYRVQEVLRLLADPERRQHKMLAIAFDAGFNSKPAFNAIFKKLTGLTPSQYRSKLTLES